MKTNRAGHLCTVQIHRGERYISTSLSGFLSMQFFFRQEKYQNPRSFGLVLVDLLLLHWANWFHRLKDNSAMVVEVAKSGHNVTVLLLSSKPKYHRHGQMAVASEVTDPVPRPTPKVAALGRPQGQVALFQPSTLLHSLLTSHWIVLSEFRIREPFNLCTLMPHLPSSSSYSATST